jgi:organic radical activating enzyme
MANKYFPIKTETACRLKWAWSSLYLNSGVTGSCHRASISNLTTENFFNFHNTERKLIDRQAMLDGKWPGHGCEYCRDTELAGGYSDRQYQIDIPGVYPKELDIDPTKIQVEPVLLDVFFNNICNLACIYCTSELSSRIEAEDKKFNKSTIELTDSNTHSGDQYKSLVPLFWKWLDKGYDKLQRIQILGGEPFVQNDFFQLIEYIEQHPNPKLELCINSNLIIKKDILVEFVLKIKEMIAKKKLKKIEIIASVDCWGVEQEYIRHGFKCKIFEENIKFLLSNKFIVVGIMSTINSLSINSMPLLAKKFMEWNAIKEIQWFNYLVLPIDQHILSPKFFDYSVFDQPLQQVVDLIEPLSERHTKTKDTITGIMQKLKYTSKKDIDKQQKLVYYLNEIDQRRNLDWKKTFPWLEQFVGTDHVV